jgi:tetratricopeptide (TPR) repeat protein
MARPGAAAGGQPPRGGLSQHELAPLSGYSRSTIANAETGRQRVPRGFWKSCDVALGTGSALARGHDEVLAAERSDHLHTAMAARQARTTTRNAGLPGAAAPGVGADSGDSPDPAQAEPLRQWLDTALTDGTVSPASLESWEQAVLEHGRATRSRPAAQHVVELGADLSELGQAIRNCHAASSLRGLVRTAAQISGLMCLQFVRLDEREAFQRWASTARTAATEAGDPGILSWVLAQEAYGHYYSNDLPAAVTVARRSQALMRRTPQVGAALAAALEARAQAARGRVGEARRALGRAEAILDVLDPASMTASAFSYTESQFRFHQENAYTLLGDTSRALLAQERALELCGPGDYTDWALTRLDRAQCMSRGGDHAAAVAHAADTLTQLQTVQSQGIIARRARDLVLVLPAAYANEPAVRDFEDLLVNVASSRKGNPEP